MTPLLACRRSGFVGLIGGNAARYDVVVNHVPSGEAELKMSIAKMPKGRSVVGEFCEELLGAVYRSVQVVRVDLLLSEWMGIVLADAEI